MSSDFYLDDLDRFRSHYKLLQEELFCHKAQVHTLTKKLVEKQRGIEMYLELFAEMNKELRRYSEVAIGLYQTLERVAPKLSTEEKEVVRQKLDEVKEFAAQQLVPRAFTPIPLSQARKRVVSKEETSQNPETDPKKPKWEVTTGSKMFRLQDQNSAGTSHSD